MQSSTIVINLNTVRVFMKDDDLWISVGDAMPIHAFEVKSKGSDGRVFNTQYFINRGDNGSFKLVGKVFDHDNVTHWRYLK